MRLYPDPIHAPHPPADATVAIADDHVITVPNARTLDGPALAAATHRAYLDLRDRVTATARPHLARVWNYVPAITAPTRNDPGNADRYMAFNAGRYAALLDWFGPAGLPHLVPAATGVGTAGPDLVIRALSTADPGRIVQNPDQTPPVDYSVRYGPRPPCFARARRYGRTLLVAGTAAIRGEDSVAGDLHAQLDLTLAHLAALAGGLRRFTHLRAYLPDPADAPHVAGRLRADAGDAAVELVRAELCRRELRVEIEGVAVESGPA